MVVTGSLKRGHRRLLVGAEDNVMTALPRLSLRFPLSSLVRQKKLGTHNPYVRLSTRDSQCLLLPHNTNLQDSVLMSI